MTPKFPDSYDAFIFDLDNTLYNEHDYLTQAYGAIAKALSSDVKQQDVLQTWMIDRVQHIGRTHLIDALLAHFAIPSDQLPRCLTVLRTFSPTPMPLFPGAFALLQQLVALKKRLFVVTNGHPIQQRNKIRHMRWLGLDQHIQFVFAATLAPKPAPAAVRYIIDSHRLIPAFTVMTGDGPEDAIAAHAAGIDFVPTSDWH